MDHWHVAPTGLPNKPLQTDERRAAIAAYHRLILVPLAAERQSRYADKEVRSGASNASESRRGGKRIPVLDHAWIHS